MLQSVIDITNIMINSEKHNNTNNFFMMMIVISLVSITSQMRLNFSVSNNKLL